MSKEETIEYLKQAQEIQTAAQPQSQQQPETTLQEDAQSNNIAPEQASIDPSAQQP